MGPRLLPKVYAGKPKISPRIPVHLPGINSGMGGYRALSQRQQFELMTNYPPAFPTAQKSQTTPGTKLPHSTTFGFGYNFDRARRDAPFAKHVDPVTGYRATIPAFRPVPLAGECPQGKMGR